MKITEAPAVLVTALHIKYPFPLLRDISSERPVPTQFEAKCGRVTSAVSLHRCVEELDQQVNSLAKIVRFLSDQLDAEYRETVQAETEELESRMYSESKEAKYQFRIGVTYISSASKEEHFITETYLHLLEKVDATLATLDFSLIEQQRNDTHPAFDWERNVNESRLAEIEAKQALVDSYRCLLPRLHHPYLAVFYVGYSAFHAHSQSGALKVIEELGGLNLHLGFLDDKVEILISEAPLIRIDSYPDDVAVNIGGVVYGQAPTAWDLRTKAHYIITQQVKRDTVGYVLALSAAQKLALFQAIIRRIGNAEPGTSVGHGCAKTFISAFHELGMDIVDPSLTFDEAVSPTNINHFLKHSDRVEAINRYPKK